MTDTQQEPPSPAAPRLAARATRPARALEWFVRREALATAHARLDALSPVGTARLARARAAFGASERLVASGSEPRAESPDEAESLVLALSLLREAAFWALTAMSPDVDQTDLASALRTAPGSRVADAAGGEDGVARARAALVERTFQQTAELEAPALAADLASAKAFVSGLLTALDVRARLIPTLRRERYARLSGAVVFAAALVVLVPWLTHVLGPNLVEAAPWRTSSSSGELPATGVGFHPPEGRFNIFFHTREEASPWIEFDIGAVRDVGYLSVNNRMDCCQERAAPLVLEVSTDRTRWTEVARQTERFYDWRQWFGSHPARFVRLRALRPTILHLGSVFVN
ncbi:MAG: discoidin domain-containing protein [Deltaproteobacteria bacterium]